MAVTCKDGQLCDTAGQGAVVWITLPLLADGIGYKVTAAQDTALGTRYVRQPLLFDGAAFPIRRGVPALGEANADYP